MAMEEALRGASQESKSRRIAQNRAESLRMNHNDFARYFTMFVVNYSIVPKVVTV